MYDIREKIAKDLEVILSEFEDGIMTSKIEEEIANLIYIKLKSYENG